MRCWTRPPPNCARRSARKARAAMDEFSLIRRYFSTQDVKRGDVVLGIGDDAALLRVPPGQELAVTTDSLVSGVHFPEGLDAESVGHRSLAANLSDLAAMGRSE